MMALSRQVSEQNLLSRNLPHDTKRTKLHVHITILTNRILAVLAPQNIFILLVFSTKLGEVSTKTGTRYSSERQQCFHLFL